MVTCVRSTWDTALDEARTEYHSEGRSNTMTKQAQQGGGTVVRAPDGSLYYITDADLESYRLPEDKAAAVRKVIENDMQGFASLPEDHRLRLGLNTALGIPVAMSKTKSVAIPSFGGAAA